MATTNDEFGIDWDKEAERAAKEIKDGFTNADFFNYFADLIKPDSVVLELGCNIGNWYPTWKNFAEKHKIKITYVGLDFSLRGIEIARERYKGIQFLYQNATDMNFKEQVDVIFTHTMLQHVSIKTKEILAAKIWTALVPDGLLIIQENTATISDGTWASIKGWVDFFEKRGFKSIRNHDIGSGGTGMVFQKREKEVVP